MLRGHLKFREGGGAMREEDEIIIGILCGIIATPIIWFAICLFLQLDELFK